MRFGQRLEAAAQPEWKDAYVNYKELKQLLSLMDRRATDPTTLARNAGLDGKFVSLLLFGIHKATTFYLQKVKALAATLRSLLPKLLKPNTLVRLTETAAQALQNNPSFFSSTDFPAPAAAHPLLFAASESITTDFVPHSRLVDGSSPQSDETIDGAKDLESLPPRLRESIADFFSLCSDIDALRRFSMLNCLAVSKITKKHDKNSILRLKDSFISLLTLQPFCTSKALASTYTLARLVVEEIMTVFEVKQLGVSHFKCSYCSSTLVFGMFYSGSIHACYKCIFESATSDGTGSIADDHLQIEDIRAAPLIGPALLERIVPSKHKFDPVVPEALSTSSSDFPPVNSNPSEGRSRCLEMYSDITQEAVRKSQDEHRLAENLLYGSPALEATNAEELYLLRSLQSASSGQTFQPPFPNISMSELQHVQREVESYADKDLSLQVTLEDVVEERSGMFQSLESVRGTVFGPSPSQNHLSSNRRNFACEECHRAKAACEGGQPCHRCIRLRRACKQKVRPANRKRAKVEGTSEEQDSSLLMDALNEATKE